MKGRAVSCWLLAVGAAGLMAGCCGGSCVKDGQVL